MKIMNSKGKLNHCHSAFQSNILILHSGLYGHHSGSYIPFAIQSFIIPFHLFLVHLFYCTKKIPLEERDQLVSTIPDPMGFSSSLLHGYSAFGEKRALVIEHFDEATCYIEKCYVCLATG